MAALGALYFEQGKAETAAEHQPDYLRVYLRQKGRGQNAWPKSMLKICEMTEKEVQEIAAIEAENFSKPWSKKGFLDAVRDEHALYLTAWEEETPVGYAGMWIAL